MLVHVERERDLVFVGEVATMHTRIKGQILHRWPKPGRLGSCSERLLVQILLLVHGALILGPQFVSPVEPGVDGVRRPLPRPRLISCSRHCLQSNLFPIPINQPPSLHQLISPIKPFPNNDKTTGHVRHIQLILTPSCRIILKNKRTSSYSKTTDPVTRFKVEVETMHRISITFDKFKLRMEIDKFTPLLKRQKGTTTPGRITQQTMEMQETLMQVS